MRVLQLNVSLFIVFFKEELNAVTIRSNIITKYYLTPEKVSRTTTITTTSNIRRKFDVLHVATKNIQ